MVGVHPRRDDSHAGEKKARQSHTLGAFTAAATARPIYNINGSGRQVNISELPNDINTGVTANVLSGDQTTTEVPGGGQGQRTISNSGEQGQQVGVTNQVTIGGEGDGLSSGLEIGTSSNDPISEQGSGVTGTGNFEPSNDTFQNDNSVTTP